jgi:hypothetical protein
MLNSTKILLKSIVDYAGLFPPAALDMRQAMENYARYQMSAAAWMLGRFILPASRLEEFIALLPSVCLKPACLKQWSLSLILTADWREAIAQIQSFTTPEIAITALELPPLPCQEIMPVLADLPGEIETFVEIPLSEDPVPYLEGLKNTGAAAKIRTGGVTAAAFPTSAQLERFITACAEAVIPFKATAGLHHPLPNPYRLTCKPDSPSSRMHGFLNVAILSALLFQQKNKRQSITSEQAFAVLDHASLEQFQFSDSGISWNGHFLDCAALATTRQHFFRSFGSCSFQEPVQDLQTLHLLRNCS